MKLRNGHYTTHISKSRPFITPLQKATTIRCRSATSLPNTHPTKSQQNRNMSSQLLASSRWTLPTIPKTTFSRPSTVENRHFHVTSAKSFATCKARKRYSDVSKQGFGVEEESWGRVPLQAALWGAETVYVLWLFLLPYAPGDPVWAISSETLNEIVGLSLNFFFILPILNSNGIHALEAPVLHPVSEGLFNFVIGWTLMFAPLLFTDYKRDKFKGSLEVLWGMQMFLTNTFLIPYMAIRLNDVEEDSPAKEPSSLALLMTRRAAVVGTVGGVVCLLSIFWSFFGRGDGGFGEIAERWEFFGRYIGSDRLAYAFIWDIVLYSIFQPWLIGDNLQNMRENNVGTVSILRFVPVLGLVVYLLSLDDE